MVRDGANNPLEKLRHSGEGRNPVEYQIPTQVGQQHGFVRFAAVCFAGFRPSPE
jgi:hypothetical protein